MEKKDVELTCPCCETRILVDVRTGRILRSRRAEELDERGKPVVNEGDWTSAADKALGRLSSAEERFDEGLSSERGRGKSLDDLFRKASERVQSGDDDEEEEDGT